MKKDYGIISFLQAGSRRLKILRGLKKEKTPKQITIECDISISNVSVSLKELKDKGLIICLNEEQHIYRYYKITKKGVKAIEDIEGL